MFTFQLFIFFAAIPNAIISNPVTDTSLPTGNTIVFSAFSSDPESGDYTYHWSFSTGETFEGQSIQYSVPQAGTLLVHMTARDTLGQESTPDSRYVYVTAPADFLFIPKINQIQTSSRIIHPETEITATALVENATSPPITLLWFWHDGTQTYRTQGDEAVIRFPNPAVQDRNYPLSVIARDASGRHSQPYKVDIYVAEGNLPPEGHILSPGTNTTISLEETVLFSGDATDYEGDTPLTLSWSTPDGTDAQGDSFSWTFHEAGYYPVSLKATDSKGNTDPNIPVVYINVLADQITEITSSIQFPTSTSTLFTGESAFFSGVSLDTTHNTLIPGFWTLRKVTPPTSTQTFQGDRLPRITFEDPGLYIITYQASFQGTTSKVNRKNMRWIRVRDRIRMDTPALHFNSDGPIILANGSTVELEIGPSELITEDMEFYWAADGILLGNSGPAFSHKVNLSDDAFTPGDFPGLFNLQIDVVGVDRDHRVIAGPLTKHINIYQSTRPALIALSGHENSETLFFPLGTRFQPLALVDNPSNLNMKYTWHFQKLDGSMNVIRPGLDPGVFQLDESGLFLLNLDAITQDGSLFAGRTIFNYIHVYDPEATPETRITQPVSSRIAVDQGNAFTFTGFASDPSFEESPFSGVMNQRVTNQLTWIHTKPDGTREEFSGSEYEIQFTRSGTHQVSLETTNNMGLSDVSPATRTVFVEGPVGSDRFEPNDEMGQAALILPGQLENLSLSTTDPVDWYVLNIQEEGSSLQFRLDLLQADQDISLQILTVDSGIIQDQILRHNAINHFTLNSAIQGLYYLKFQITNAQKQFDDGLTFGVGVNTLQPQLSYPYVYSTEMHPFSVQIVNPTDQDGEILLEARSPFGELLSHYQITLPPHGKLDASVMSLFPQTSVQDISWIQVQSDAAVLGTGAQIASDFQTGFAEPAMKGSYQELIIPHIAKLTDQWYTLAALTNSTDASILPEFLTTTQNYTMNAPLTSFESSDFDFLDFFQGSIPDDGEWGRFIDHSSNKCLTGWEIFGKLDGHLQVAAISMIPPHLKNPNFTYVRRDLYFPHIASDTASFWTGIAFVNTGTYPGTGNLKAYDNTGNLLAEESIELSPGEKRVDLVPAFFPSLPPTTPIAWLVLETSDLFQGFELFGSNDGTDRRLAGFPAARGASSELHFLNVYADTALFWTGLAIVNLSEQAATLSYTGFSTSGTALTTCQRTVGAREKDVILMKNLFTDVPPDISWIRVQSDQPIAGFQLFGDLTGNFMAGTLAQ